MKLNNWSYYHVFYLIVAAQNISRVIMQIFDFHHYYHALKKRDNSILTNDLDSNPPLSRSILVKEIWFIAIITPFKEKFRKIAHDNYIWEKKIHFHVVFMKNVTKMHHFDAFKLRISGKTYLPKTKNII
jgi:hypothetical protein